MLLEITMLPRCTARDSAVGWRATCYCTLPTSPPAGVPFFYRRWDSGEIGHLLRREIRSRSLSVPDDFGRRNAESPGEVK